MCRKDREGAGRKSDSYDGSAERTSDGNIYCIQSTARVKSKGKEGIRRKPKLRETQSKSYCKYMAALLALCTHTTER